MSDQRLQGNAKSEDKTSWDPWLILMIVLGVVVIFVFGFGMDWDVFNMRLTHWASWEVAALLWTGLFTIYYYAKFPFVGINPIDKVVSVLLLLVLPSLAVSGAYFLLVRHKHYLHVLSVCAIGAVLLVTDLLLHRYHVGEQKKAFLECVLIADVPVVCAFLVLLPYLYIHRHAEESEVFFSGAVSFELVTSNILFLLIQMGITRKIWAGREVVAS